MYVQLVQAAVRAQAQKTRSEQLFKFVVWIVTRIHKETQELCLYSSLQIFLTGVSL